MKIICNECDYRFEHYNNIYGTYCPKCNSFIKPIERPGFIKKYNFKLEKLREKFLNKLRNIK